MQAACPKLDPETFYWRLTCALGAFIFAQSFGDRVDYALGGAQDTTNWRRVIEEIAGFVVRGMG